MPFLALLGFGKSLFGSLFKWLSGLSVAQLCCIGLFLFAAGQHVALIMAHRHEAKSDAQIVKLTQQLKAISTAKNTQKVITQTRIQTVVKTIHDADEKAKKVEQAPPAADCKTNSQVLGADV